MRRGQMGWSEADLPLAVLRQRLSRLQAALKNESLGGLVLYTNIARPAAVYFLTGFTPYWSEALLLVPAAGEPVLATALSKRVSPWIRSVMPIGSVEHTPKLAAAIARKLTEHQIRKVGILELDQFPSAQATLLQGSDAAVVLHDATALFRSVRVHADQAEIALVRRADDLARQCLASFERDGDARRVAGDIEARARSAGAEEAFVGINPDPAHSSAFLRGGRLGTVGRHFAVRLSLSFRGAWVRRAITLGGDAREQSSLADADAAFERALASSSPALAVSTLQHDF
ncbi:MAG: aminopeptidase P family N-terminal domain-containing protein, partial [Xanthobacteraceae bacterium]|nr:aminopeptidase P family N-terminal domain-containing protein [Xanthobacteraceae bacterium]